MSNDPNQIIADVMRMDEQNRQALSMLLEQQCNKQGHLLALRVRMGLAPSYVTSASLNWVADNVHFAGDLPIFKGKVDEKSKKVPVDEATSGDIQQRQPDWTRQLPMATYLATRKNHKFPPLLVVGYQQWVYEEGADEWGPDGKAMHESVTAVPLVPSGEYCDLDSRNTNYYALDGQHRLMAIMGLKELLTTGQLHAMDKNRNPKRGRGITREEIIQAIQSQEGGDEGSIHAQLEMLLKESIGIEIIPAVSIGETRRDALFRLRGTFVDVNEQAKRLTKGEIGQLDESNGFRVVARNVMVSHTLLKGKVEHQQQQLSKKSAHYTTLKTLAEIAENYLGTIAEFSLWKNPMLGDKNLGFIRPDESELAHGTRVLSRYFDALETLPSHTRLIQGKIAADIREEEGEDNILFRPIAQMAVAQALAILESEHEMSLDSLVQELAKQEDKGQLSLHSKQAPWFGVLCDTIDGKMLRHAESQRLCIRLLVYLLGGGIADDEEREALRAAFAEFRRIGDDERGHEMAVDANGVPSPVEDVKLPQPWR